MLVSTRGELARRIAEQLGCDDQTVVAVLHAFNVRGLDALHEGLSRPHRRRHFLASAPSSCALLHRSPRDFGHPTSLWTLDFAAQVSFAQVLTSRLVSGEAVRTTLRRLGIGWKRAKHWIISPDSEYARQKGGMVI